jgi:MYXO-CTERM domain-containing protein
MTTDFPVKSGCGCRAAGAPTSNGVLLAPLAALAAALVARRIRRRSKQT